MPFAALRGLVRNWKFDLNKAVENLQKIPLKNSNKQYQQVIQNNNTRRVRKVRSRGII